MATISELEADLQSGITVDRVFSHSDPIEWPIALAGRHLWRNINIEFRGFAVGKGDESEDEPEFMTTSQVTPNKVGYARYPVGVTDPPSVATGKAVTNFQLPVLEYSALDDGARHRVITICTALDADGDSLWEAFLDSLDSDVRATVGTVMGGLSLPAAVAGFTSSPAALMRFFLSKLGDILTDDPEEIGQRTIADIEKYWLRPPHMTAWTALKFLCHQIRGKEPWYVTMWRISLEAGANPAAAILRPGVSVRNTASGTIYAPGATPGPTGPGPGIPVTPPAPGGQPGDGAAPAGGGETGGGQGAGSGPQNDTPPPGGEDGAGNAQQSSLANPDEQVTGLYASIMASADKRAAAAIRVLQGESIEAVAEDSGMTPDAIAEMKAQLLSGGLASFQGYLRSGVFGELKRLRERLAKLENGAD